MTIVAIMTNTLARILSDFFYSLFDTVAAVYIGTSYSYIVILTVLLSSNSFPVLHFIYLTSNIKGILKINNRMREEEGWCKHGVE